MKKNTLTMTAAALALTLASGAAHAEIKMGIILGFTGPIESLTPAMAASAELAFSEASASGLLLGGETITVVRADSTCIDAAAATTAAERLITSDRVTAIMGADCSGVTIAIANNVAVPNGVVMVSPSATTPALSTIEDNGYFFRTSPSDTRQGEVMAQILTERGIKSVAITYTNNDYGKGLSDSFSTAFKGMGGSVPIIAAHEDGKGDYSAEVGALSASGADVLVVLGYLDQGGRGIIQASLDSDAFDQFVVGDGMIGQSLIDNVDGDLNGTIGTASGSNSNGAKIFLEVAKAAGIDGDGGPYRAESYDAAALLVLAMQKGGDASRAGIARNLMSVANAPGTKILPGELAKGLQILADGGDIDYEGASNVELTDVGDAAGSYAVQEIRNGKFETVDYR